MEHCSTRCFRENGSRGLAGTSQCEQQQSDGASESDDPNDIGKARQLSNTDRIRSDEDAVRHYGCVCPNSHRCYRDDDRPGSSTSGYERGRSSVGRLCYLRLPSSFVRWPRQHSSPGNASYAGDGNVGGAPKSGVTPEPRCLAISTSWRFYFTATTTSGAILD